MPNPPSLFNRKTLTAVSAAATLTLSACGGGLGQDIPPPGGPPPTPAIEALAGDWVQKGCAKAGAQSFRKLLRATVTSPSTLDHSEGVLTFDGSECAGTSQLSGPSMMGTVTFARAQADANLTAHWGVFRAVIGSRFGSSDGTIWTLRPNNLLCLLGDEIPTLQPSLAAVADSLATIPAANCFSR